MKGNRLLGALLLGIGMSFNFIGWTVTNFISVNSLTGFFFVGMGLWYIANDEQKE